MKKLIILLMSITLLSACGPCGESNGSTSTTTSVETEKPNFDTETNLNILVDRRHDIYYNSETWLSHEVQVVNGMKYVTMGGDDGLVIVNYTLDSLRYELMLLQLNSEDIEEESPTYTPYGY